MITISNKSILKKLITLLFLLIIIFRSVIYRNLIKYSKIDTRTNIKLTDKCLILEIDEYCKDKDMNLKQIIDESGKITCEKLGFTFDKSSSNPNILIKTKKANCIGYSSLFNSVGNYLLRKQGMYKEYEFIHLEGRLDFFGVNIHRLFNNHFFHSHDFNQIRNKKNGKSIFVDPSLRDYLGIEEVECINCDNSTD